MFAFSRNLRLREWFGDVRWLGLCSALNHLNCWRLLVGSGASTIAFMACEAWPNNLAGLYWFCCLDTPLCDQPTELLSPSVKEGKKSYLL